MDAKQIFLVSGQMLVDVEGGGKSLSPAVVEKVVVAEDGPAAYAALAEKMPDFRPLGLTALADYEKAVAKIKATLKGVETGWGLVLEPGLNV